MNTRKLTLSAILLAIGFVLHYIIPGTLGAMKPDASLAMMFVAILICDDYKSTVAIGIASGILAGLTSSFPGGQVPNLIDKIITSHVVFLLIAVLKTFKLNANVKIAVISIIGTLVSGTAFLTSALLIVGLPAPFISLFLVIVLPAVVANTVLATVVFGVAEKTLKLTSFAASK